MWFTGDHRITMVPRKLQYGWRSRNNITIELENRLPASLGNVYQSDENDIIARDASPATDSPVRIFASLPAGFLH